jgi:hypothetical protein
LEWHPRTFGLRWSPALREAAGVNIDPARLATRFTSELKQILRVRIARKTQFPGTLYFTRIENSTDSFQSYFSSNFSAHNGRCTQ